MKAPICQICGKAEWNHVCAGKPLKQAKQPKTGLPTGSRSDEREKGKATVSGANARKGDRHKPGYQANLMQARRAIASGRAERYPRA